MKRPGITITLAAVSLAASAAPALAGDPKFEYGKADELKDVTKTVWAATAEAGLVLTTGNSRSTTVTGAVKATRKQQKNKLGIEATGTFARASNAVPVDADMNGTISDDEITRVSKTSAENVAGKLRYDRFLTEWDSLFVAALGAVDTVAGKDFAGGGQLGYARTVYKTEKHTVNVEAGYDFSYENYVDVNADSIAIHSARGFVGYEGKLTENTSLTGSVEALDNLNASGADRFKDLRLTGNAALSTKITKDIALSLSFMAKYDNVPAPAALEAPLMADPTNPPLSDKLDTTTKASLIVTLL